MTKLDRISWSELHSSDGQLIPRARHGHILESTAYRDLDGNYQEQLYLLWGGDYGLFNDIFSMDYYNQVWKPVTVNGDDAAPRAASAYASHGSEIYIFGGISTHDGVDEISNQFLIFDVRSKKFTAVTPTSHEDIPSPRMGASLVYVPASLTRVNPCLYLFGGLGERQSFLNDVYTFNLSSKIWTKVTPKGTPPGARESHTAALWPDIKNNKDMVCICNRSLTQMVASQSMAATYFHSATTSFCWILVLGNLYRRRSMGVS
jgi:Galactose oxidase, central domain/Kelch motif